MFCVPVQSFVVRYIIKPLLHSPQLRLASLNTFKYFGPCRAHGTRDY